MSVAMPDAFADGECSFYRRRMMHRTVQDVLGLAAKMLVHLVQNTLISVALCTHNGARFIGEQIRSICRQTMLPDEIVISDDASSDDSIDLAKQMLEECLRPMPDVAIQMRIMQNDLPLRVTKNFEAAVVACRGSFIALCDQDDVWHPERLARMLGELERRPDLLLLHSNARLVGANREDLGQSLFEALEVKPAELTRIHEGSAFNVLLRRNLVTGATTIFRGDLLRAALPFPPEWLHDEWLAIIAAAIGRVDVIEDALIDYRQHGGNQIGARRDSFAEKIKKAFAARGDTHQKQAVKAEVLLERLVSLGAAVPAEIVQRARLKLAHQRFRADLPEHRLARIIPVVGEALSGRYGQCGRGPRGVVRDLFESV